MFEIERENGSRDRKICSIQGKVRDREVRNSERLCSLLLGNFKGPNILFEIERYSRQRVSETERVHCKAILFGINLRKMFSVVRLNKVTCSLILLYQNRLTQINSSTAWLIESLWVFP